MNQLIFGGSFALPQVSGDRYRSYPATLSVQVDMISGRRVNELRGFVQKIEYSCDYLPDADMRTLLGYLRSGQPFEVAYLPDDDSDMETGTFLTEKMEQPAFAFDRGGRAYWHNISFVLREVNPRD